jgi:hypothetical protein
MPANMRKLMEGVPRPMEIMAHDERNQTPMGRRRVSRPEQNRRTEAYLAGVVGGDIPLDDTSAEVIREYLDAHHARQ